MSSKIQKYTTIAVFYFLIAAVLGITLRLFPILDMDVTYRFIVHTHSHIALLGWVYIGLMVLIYQLLIKKTVATKKRFFQIFWSTQITIIGMLISFPFKGYAFFSILFSTLFLFTSYWFYAFFKKNIADEFLNSIVYKFINTSLFFMVISSIGPWALGYIMNTLGTTTHWYKNAVYFYLHFQYNGWFIFALFGLFFFSIQQLQISLARKRLSLFFKLMLLSCVSTFFLSILWIEPHPTFYIIAAFGALLQVIALLLFYGMLKNIRGKLTENFSSGVYLLLKIALLLFCLKITAQLCTSIPYFAMLVSQLLDIVIGYLHLIFLGIVSLALFAFLNHFKLLKLSKFWTSVYITGFLLSELLIFYKGVCNWQSYNLIDNYYFWLMLFSGLMPIGIAGILYHHLKPSPTR